jgi:hypothetical protein
MRKIALVLGIVAVAMTAMALALNTASAEPALDEPILVFAKVVKPTLVMEGDTLTVTLMLSPTVAMTQTVVFTVTDPTPNGPFAIISTSVSGGVYDPTPPGSVRAVGAIGPASDTTTITFQMQVLTVTFPTPQVFTNTASLNLGQYPGSIPPGSLPPGQVEVPFTVTVPSRVYLPLVMRDHAG